MGLTQAGWLAAGRLRMGDVLRTASGGGVMVVGLRWQAGNAAVYTLTVTKDHTFFVGAARVLVHNSLPCKPSVTDPKLANIINDLFRPGVKVPIGNGGVADAIREELRTGNPVGGRFHSQKGQDYVRALENWLRRNPGASAADRSAAQAVLQDLLDALAGK